MIFYFEIFVLLTYMVFLLLGFFFFFLNCYMINRTVEFFFKIKNKKINKLCVILVQRLNLYDFLEGT